MTMKWSSTPEKGVWISYHKGRVYLLKSLESPISHLRAKNTKYRDLV